MKRSILIIMIIIGIFTLTACKQDKDVSDSMKFKVEYESLNGKKSEDKSNKIREVSIPEDNPIIYASADDITKMIDQKESFIVYFGFARCPWCRSVIEPLIEVCKDNDIDKLYYVDIEKIRDKIELDENNNLNKIKEGSQGYNKLLKQLDSVLEDYILKDSKNNEISTDEKRIYAPSVVAVKKGKAIKLETGISSKQNDPYMELSEEITKDTYDKFKCLVECISKNKNICDKSC